jgi:hypothetical protein
MDYRDVTHDYFKSRRTTNPLQPTYNCRIEEGKDPVEIGKIEKNTPNCLPPIRKDPIFRNLSLNTTDIKGA